MKNNNKVCVYTVVCGEYDIVNPVMYMEPGVDYICFTDDKYLNEVPDCWQHIVIENDKLSTKDLNRYYKINVTKILSEYERSIYIDGNIEIIKLPLVIRKCMHDESVDIAMYDHNLRNDIYHEANQCIEFGLDYYWKFKRQITRYNQSGYKSDKLFEANIIYRKHTEKMSLAMSRWWDEYLSGAKRDQISFGYSMHVGGIDVTSLGLSDVRNAQANFKIHHHEYPLKYKLNKRCIKVINKICLKLFGKLTHE